MKILKQLGIILCVTLVAEGISAILPFSFPANIIGLLLMLLLFILKVVKLEQVDEVATFLMANMAFFFVPGGVGIVNYLELFLAQWWKFAIIYVVTLVLVFWTTAWTAMAVLRLLKRRKENAGGQS